MIVELYKKLCGWLLDWNTSDGVFGHCFLVLTWNLSCCTHSTANIWLCEIEWLSTFDAFEIYFAHMNMDQTGDEAKYSHHLYSNPCCPLICPVLALAFYFSCCCNLPQNGQSQLFPGQDKYQWFSEMLSHLIQDHKAEVSELVVHPKIIGKHSIRKGAVTYMSSLHCGPSISSVCIHAGWTMGTVKDVYMWYLSSGDQFVYQKMLQKDTFKAPCCCFENVPNTALTIVCTINVSIDCNGFDVSNLPQKKKLLK